MWIEQNVLQATDVSKRYEDGDIFADVLKGVNVSVNKGERVGIVGASGSGKSTLLHLLAGLEEVTSGVISIDGTDLHGMTSGARAQLRSRSIGFIYQFHHLLPEFTALENVAMPLLIRGFDRRSANEAATETLEKVGLGHRTKHKPGELSGGERQRCAVARAVVTKPLCIFADEPTGNLDAANALQVYNLLEELTLDSNAACILVTHDRSMAGRMDRVLELRDGCLLPVEL